ncbi:MAG: hypothetical protein CFH44_00197 [Proteobacteria bacterium]|nr:MAG: hypothetical protein CFH44_00197 [Pseudomonadota bacterium]
MANASLFIKDTNQLAALKNQLEENILAKKSVAECSQVDEFDKQIAWSEVYEYENDLKIVDKLLNLA